jgi:Domain of unknown function (DUF4105)
MIIKSLIIAFAVIVFGYFVFSFIVRPSNNRDWMDDQAILPRAKFSDDAVTISNIRNINYRTTSDYDVAYYDKTFDLNKLESIWFIVEPFSGHGMGAAHTFFSFGFEGGEYISISVEIRKQKGESFSPTKGLFRQYELMYVVADERDVVKLRSNHRMDDVYMYPGKTTKEHMRMLFVSMLERANKLAEKPEFYNTLTNTCSTNLAKHVNGIVEGRIPYSYKVLMPAYSDELAHDLGLIDSTLTLSELRAKYRINEKAMTYADDPLFSQRIRE